VRLIYHLVPLETWEQCDDGPYRAASLESEGFIHCSNRDQVARVANMFYTGHDKLLVVAIALPWLTSPFQDDEIASGECFPHIYGPINRDAIIDVQPMKRDEAGQWMSP
jgi:uncharacterized protein (DUF952 family)